ncbi:MAG TPA: PAS domain S-box protein [Bryobacteraceae bacterium]|nr:PAS domain S-box protein [Bryobacteraceae bacterium]
MNPELEALIAERTKDLSEANRKLKDSEAKLRAFLESASQGILAVDLRGRIALVNAQIEEMFGYSREELLNQRLDVLIPERFRHSHERYRESYFERPKSRPMGLGMDLAGVRKDGTEFPIEISLSYTGEGDDMLALAFMTDITDRKRLEEQLLETAKLESLGVLAGGIAHDFNNLLVGVMGNASLALDALPPELPRLRPMLEGVVTASERAADLVRQLLAYSGKGRFIIQPVDISGLIRETVGLIKASVPKNVELDLDLRETANIDADPSQMQQLIMNLIINGAEAISEGAGGTVRVRTCVREVAEVDGGPPGQNVEIVVEDNGSGMDEATRVRMFDPFFTTKFTGRGLGLAAVKGIVRGHKGVIHVESEPGKGTRFTVLLPVSQSGPASTEPSRSGARPASGTVLVVDDESLVRLSARMALERYGYRVLLAENGSRGVEIFKQFAGDIVAVVLDLTMPVMGGEETLRGLREIRPDVRVILSSGYNEVQAISRFQGQGLDGFLQKPYTATRLVEVVQATASACAAATEGIPGPG